MSDSFWTDVRRALLESLWGKQSAAAIAAELGCTRNAVIGRAYRSGLPCLVSRDACDYWGFWTAERRQFVWDNYRSNGGGLDATQIGAAVGTSDRAVRKLWQRMRRREGWQYKASSGPAPALTDADFRGCRFVSGNALPLRPGMYCGAPVIGPEHAWCKEHRGIVYQVVRVGEAAGWTPERRAKQAAVARMIHQPAAK